MIVLLTISYHNPVTAADGVLRVATSPYRHPSAPGPYQSRIAENGVGVFSRSIFDDGLTFGAGGSSVGVVQLAAADGGLDWLNRMAIDGRPVEIATIEGEGTVWGDRRIIASLVASSIQIGDDLPELRFHDASVALLDAPIQTATFAGDNSDGNGVGGDETLKDVWVPVLEGQVRGVEPVWVNTAKYLGILSDRNTAGGAIIVEALDGGGPITQGDSYPTMAALEAAATATGKYDWCPGSATEPVGIKLGSAPGSAVVCKVSLGAASDQTAGQIFRRVLTERCGVSVADINADDIAALDAANGAILGTWTGRNEMTVRAFLDYVVGSVGAGYWQDRRGQWRIRRVARPSGDPVARFAVADAVERPLSVNECNILSLIPAFTSRDGGGVPFNGVTCRFARMHVTLDKKSVVEIALDRVNELCEEYQEASASNDAVKTLHPHSVDKSWDTAFDRRADAQAEAARRLDMYSGAIRSFSLAAPMTAVSLYPDPGDVLLVSHSRFGLAGGHLFTVSEVETDILTQTVTFKIWRIEG